MCVQPISVKVEKKLYKGSKSVVSTHWHLVPCGKCPECRGLRRLQWTFRLEQEAKVHPYNYFVTLTYSDKFLPKDGYLYKPDFQLFMKRLRKNTGAALKFFACGEYGDTFGRCHWHCIVFSESPISRTDIDKSWRYGFNKFSLFSSSRAAYVVKYSQKQLFCEYPDDCVLPCSLSSQGLGDSYFTYHRRKYFKINGITCVYTNNRQKVQLPRRYYEMIFSEAERKMFSRQNERLRIDAELEQIKLYGKFAFSNEKREKLFSRARLAAEKNAANSAGSRLLTDVERSFGTEEARRFARYRFLFDTDYL